MEYLLESIFVILIVRLAISPAEIASTGFPTLVLWRMGMVPDQTAPHVAEYSTMNQIPGARPGFFNKLRFTCWCNDSHSQVSTGHVFLSDSCIVHQAQGEPND